MKVNKEKMKELVCYILGNFENGVSRELLLKILFLSDFAYCNRYEKSITNESYKKYPNSPIAIHFTEIKDELLEEGRIIEYNNLIYCGSKVEVFYNNLDISEIHLSGDEKEIVDCCVSKLSQFGCDEIVNLEEIITTKRIDKAPMDIAMGKGIKVDMNNLEEMSDS